MAQYIPPDFIRELLNRLDIVDIIDARIPLRKAGNSYKARCPFHDEKTPSFVVSAPKQIFHCFGCQKSGNVITFLQLYEHLSFIETIETLSHIAGLTIPKSSTDAIKQPTTAIDGYTLLQKASDFYRRQLKSHPAAEQARIYLQQRGISPSTINRYELGYAPNEWDALHRHLGINSTQSEHLQRTGLIIKKNAQHTYDRFRGRIMFPIHNNRGRLVGFGGRVLDDSEPKYLNSPETAYFHKGSDVYGLTQAAPKGATPPYLLLVEGYMDVIGLWEVGIPHAVATLGTATTTKQIERLFRLTSQLIFCFDGDKAGSKAAWRALENALTTLEDDRQIAFILLPEGEDPDSYARNHGKTAMIQLINQAIPLSVFFFDHLKTLAPSTTTENRAYLLQKAIPLLQQIPGPALQQLMLDQLANLTQLSVNTMMQLYKQKPTPTKAKLTQPPSSSHLTYAISLLLHNPKFSIEVTERQVFEENALPGYELFNKLLTQCDEYASLPLASLLAPWQGTKVGERLLSLATQTLTIPLEGQLAEFKDVLKRLNQQVSEKKLEELLQKAQNLGELTKKEKNDLQQLILSTKYLNED